VSLVIALVAVDAALIVAARLPVAWVGRRLRECMPLDMLMLLLGAMLFGAVIESSGAVEALSSELKRYGAPVAAVVFLLPFATGLLTGLAVLYVTIGFPLLKGLIVLPAGQFDPAATVFAFAAGYMGVLLSPVHLCLVLSRQYFGADLGKVYKRLLAPVAFVTGVALIIYFTTTRL
jgi:integral membrane protein (TIGR00529 family)